MSSLLFVAAWIARIRSPGGPARPAARSRVEYNGTRALSMRPESPRGAPRAPGVYSRTERANPFDWRRWTMANKGSILVGTIGQGIMMSADDGETWRRAGLGQGM